MSLTPTYIAVSLVTPIVYALISAALYYLASRAQITKFIWSQYPGWLDSYTLCAACIGFAFGVFCALGIGWYFDLPCLLMPGRWLGTPIVVGLCAIVWTPVAAAIHLRSLEITAGEPITDESVGESPEVETEAHLQR